MPGEVVSRDVTGIEVEQTELFQADCVRCGWHTRQSRDRSWIEQLARAHKGACPNPPPPREGGILHCGCWAYVMPGTVAGSDHWRCPNGHGPQLVVTCNVDEPAEEAP